MKFCCLHKMYVWLSGETPVVQLNFTVLAIESSFDRDTVEMCVREVLQVCNLMFYIEC